MTDKELAAEVHRKVVSLNGALQAAHAAGLTVELNPPVHPDGGRPGVHSVPSGCDARVEDRMKLLTDKKLAELAQRALQITRDAASGYAPENEVSVSTVLTRAQGPVAAVVLQRLLIQEDPSGLH